MRTDPSEGVGFDSQSERALREVRVVRLPSHPQSQRVDRRLEQRACHRVTSPSVEDGKRRRRSFDCLSQGRPASCLLHRWLEAFHPSLGSQTGNLPRQSCGCEKPKFTENDNQNENEIGWLGGVSRVEQQPPGGSRPHCY